MRFDGTIHLTDDPTRIPATMRVADGRVVIECEGEAIGDWLATDVTMDHRPEGIVLHVEGETLVVSPNDRYGFSDAVDAEAANVPTKRGLFRRSKSPADKPKAKAKQTKPAEETAASPKAEKKRSRRRTKSETPDAEDASPTPEPATPRRAVPNVSKSASVLEQAAQARSATWVDKSARTSDGTPDTDDQDDPTARQPARKRNLPPVDPPSPFGRDDAGPSAPRPKERRSPDPRREGQAAKGRLSDRVEGDEAVQRIPGRAKSLSDAVRSARDEPTLSGFRPSAEPERKDKPYDPTAEIFGDQTEPEPERGRLKRLGDRWLDLPLSYRRAALGVAILVLLWLLIPAVVATVLVLTGLVSCLVGGAGLADPSYTRRLPSQLSETRLLIAGAIMLVVGILIGLPSL